MAGKSMNHSQDYCDVTGQQVGKANRLAGEPCPYCGATLPVKGRVTVVQLDDDGAVVSSVPGPPPPMWDQISKNAPILVPVIVVALLAMYFTWIG